VSRLAYFASDDLPDGTVPQTIINALAFGGYTAEYRDTRELGHGLIVVTLSPNAEDREREVRGLLSFLRAACPRVTQLGIRDEDGYEEFVIGLRSVLDWSSNAEVVG
jgi:hypothetical protein